MLQPEPVGLLGQSASSFMLFICTVQQSALQLLLHCGARSCPGLQNKAPHFRLETQRALGLLLHTENKMERVEKEKMEAERQEERLQQWASADRVPY